LKEQREIEQTKATYLPDDGERPLWEIEQEEEEALKNDSATLTSGIWKSLQTSYVGSMIQTITGGKILEESDLKPVLDEMKEMLQSKNVAQEIADDICSSVGQALIGHRLASFTGIKNVVTSALHDAVQRILTPGTSVDVLRQVLDAKASGKIFSLVFVGINGKLGVYSFLLTFCRSWQINFAC
jgi:signal recognition particle receptor subunit alpha